MDKVSNGVDRPTRRALLKSGLAAVAATAAVAAAPRLAYGRRRPSEARAIAYAPDVLGSPIEFLGLKPGLALGAWTVLDVRSRAQSVALIVRGPDGEEYQLDVLARDPQRSGVSQSRHYSVFLVNGGDGSTRSDEQRARGALAVGHYLRWAEQRFAAPPQLVTLSQRLRENPRGSFRIA